MRAIVLILGAGLSLAACATTEGGGNGALGSQSNPVLADMPPGQRAYLGRLRCSDGQPPEFSRIGSMGIQHASHVIDGYELTCVTGTPTKVMVHMDMYHPGYTEAVPVAGFTIVP